MCAIVAALVLCSVEPQGAHVQPQVQSVPVPAVAEARPKEVQLHDEAPYFSPKRIHIEVGESVVWLNRGPALVHTVTIATTAGRVQSGGVAPGKQWAHCFAEPGVFRITCGVHPHMYGIVVVGDVPASVIDATVNGLKEAPHARAPEAEFIEFPLPIPNAVPGILEIDSQDGAWFTMGGGGWANIACPPLNHIGHLSLDGDFERIDLPHAAGGPSGLIIDDNGSVYVTELMGGRIARIDPRTKVIEQFIIPSEPAWPTGLAFDSRGQLWFSITRGNKIGCLAPSGVITEFAVPTVGAHPTGLAVDADDRVWFCERDAAKLGCLRTDGIFVEYAIPTANCKPAGIAVGEDGRIWFAERAGNRIGVFDGERFREYPLPGADSGPFFVRPDYRGDIWFTQVFGNRIGRLAPDTGQIIEYAVPTPGAWPGGLAFDSQGNVWFTEQLGNKIGVLRLPRAQASPSGMTGH